MVNVELRKHSLAFERARLDDLQETFYAREGDVQCGALVTKIIERRCTMLGLHAPQQAVVQIVEAQAPRQTSMDRIEAALNALLADQRNGGDKPH